MKHLSKHTLALSIALTMAAGVPASSALAQQEQGDMMNRISEYMTKQNVGRAVGGLLGGVVGSKFGGGSGKTAATIVGALAGYMIGGEVGSRMQESDRNGLAQSTARAIETGQPQAWSNPDTGVRTEVQVRDAYAEPETRTYQAPPLEMINRYYVATTDSHVRAGPGTNHPIVGLVMANESIPVVGRVVDENWYMVSRDGRGHGFVYAPLLVVASQQPADDNAIRAEAGSNFGGTELAQPQCTLVTQKVTMPDGGTVSEQFRTCRGADGTWEMA